MKILHLNLKGKWFDMILSGEKKEEYRDQTEYWSRRLMNDSSEPMKGLFKVFDAICFSNGYATNRKQFTIKCSYIAKGPGLQKWGAEEDKKYFIIVLGDILSKKNI